jgi:hypothetical protein
MAGNKWTDDPWAKSRHSKIRGCKFFSGPDKIIEGNLGKSNKMGKTNLGSKGRRLARVLRLVGINCLFNFRIDFRNTKFRRIGISHF